MSRWNLAVKGVAAALALALPIGCISEREHKDMQIQYETQIEGLKGTIAAHERHNAEMEKQVAYEQAKGKANAGEADSLRQLNSQLMGQIDELNKRVSNIASQNSDIFEMGENGKFVMKGDASFDAGLATLRPRAMAALDDLAKGLRTTPNIMVRIDGHTDNDPILKTKYKWTTASNFELAAARALTVLLYLEKQGIPGSQMFLTSYGEHHPRVANDSKEHKAMNRRVEIQVCVSNTTPEGAPEMNTGDHGAMDHNPIDHGTDHK